jgi:hypothetical protein
VAAGGFLVEVQLRTQRMHRQAESGAAAHRRYKPDPTPTPGAAVGAMATHLASLGRPDFIGERLLERSGVMTMASRSCALKPGLASLRQGSDLTEVHP